MQHLVGYDLESHLVQPGLLAPPIVCASASVQGEEYLWLDASRLLETLVRNPSYIIVGAKISYDMACCAAERPELLADIFELYEQGRAYDVQIGEQLGAIARGDLGLDPRTGRPIKPEPGRKRGGYSLKYCVDVRLGRDDAKRNDYWRLRYAILQRVPVELWPDEAREYPKDDVRNPVEVAYKQLELAERGELENLWNMREQVYTDFCLQLSSAWGFRTDRARYDELRRMVEATRATVLEKFRAVGFMKRDGKDDEPAIKRAVALAYGVDPASKCPRCAGSGKVASTSPSALKSKRPKLINCKVEPDASGCDSTGLDLSTAPGLPRTDAGGVSTSRDTLVESGDEQLMAFSENEGAKLADTYLPYLEKGLELPITPRCNILLANGRVSYDDVVQLLPRQVLCLWCNGRKCAECDFKGTVSGVRECHCARPGCLYCSVDYSALEVCTAAQVCLWLFGHSELARIINESRDPSALHVAFASDMLGLTFDEGLARYKAEDPTVVMARQGAKVFIFGVLGGMGSAKIVINKRSKREGITRAQDGTVYPGIRFCILLGGETRCGVQKITEWKGRHYAPMCKRCVEVAEFDLRRRFFKKFAEVAEYHRWAGDQVDDGGRAPCFRPCWECGGKKCAACDHRGWTVERWRGGMDFSTLANNGFSALAADGAKAGYRAFTRECYVDRSSPAFGARPLGLFHDEIIAEVSIAQAHDAGYRQSEIMVREMRRYVPDVWIKAEPTLMKFWCKGAKPKFDAAGRLVPWDVDLQELNTWA